MRMVSQARLNWVHDVLMVAGGGVTKIREKNDCNYGEMINFTKDYKE